MPYLLSERTTRREVLDRARAVIDRQESETWEWKNADLLRFLFSAIQALEAERPASGYFGTRRVPRRIEAVPVRSDYQSDEAWEAAVGELLDEPVLVDGRWLDALVEFVCYEAFRRDESDAASQKLALQHWQAFRDFAQR